MLVSICWTLPPGVRARRRALLALVHGGDTVLHVGVEPLVLLDVWGVLPTVVVGVALVVRGAARVTQVGTVARVVPRVGLALVAQFLFAVVVVEVVRVVVVAAVRVQLLLKAVSLAAHDGFTLFVGPSVVAHGYIVTVLWQQVKRSDFPPGVHARGAYLAGQSWQA